MKLQLDTKEKCIKIEESVNLEELFETLNKLLPNQEWKAFTLETNTTIEWTSPITIPWYPYYPTDPYPWWRPSITYSGGYVGETGERIATADSYSLAEGVYNIEI